MVNRAAKIPPKRTPTTTTEPVAELPGSARILAREELGCHQGATRGKILVPLGVWANRFRCRGGVPRVTCLSYKITDFIVMILAELASDEDIVLVD